jgi:hypothetical protein
VGRVNATHLSTPTSCSALVSCDFPAAAESGAEEAAVVAVTADPPMGTRDDGAEEEGVVFDAELHISTASHTGPPH